MPLKFLKDYVTEFGTNVELFLMVKTRRAPHLINRALGGIEDLLIGQNGEPELRYLLNAKETNKKQLFRERKKHLVHTNVLQKFI